MERKHQLKSFHCKGEITITGTSLRLKEDRDLLMRSFRDLYQGDLGYKKLFALIFSSCLKKYDKGRLRNKLSGSFTGPLSVIWDGEPKTQEYCLKTTYYHPLGERELTFEAKVEPTQMSYLPTSEKELSVLEEMNQPHTTGQALNTL